jgi:CRISPR/Cas system CSM-associated protein Csm2 small subunit
LSREERAVNMKTPPESFLLFKEELRKAQLEKERLTKFYEEKLNDVNKELTRLKEQIQSQQDMMRTTLEYATNLETGLEQFKKEISHSNTQRKNTVY